MQSFYFLFFLLQNLFQEEKDWAKMGGKKRIIEFRFNKNVKASEFTSSRRLKL